MRLTWILRPGPAIRLTMDAMSGLVKFEVTSPMMKISPWPPQVSTATRELGSSARKVSRMASEI